MRLINLTALCTFSVALALVLGATTRQAEAQACKKLKGVRNAGCVTSVDVRNKSLTKNEVRNLAGVDSFKFQNKKDKMKVPTSGWVTISALARIDASAAAGPVKVVCRIIPNGSAAKNAALLSIQESVNPDMAVPFASIVATKVYPVKVGKLKIAWQCGQTPAVAVTLIDLTARFVPTRY